MELASDEYMISKIRKHWFVLLRNSIGTIFLVVLPFIVYLWFGGQDSVIGSGAALSLRPESGVLAFLGVWWILIMWMRLFGIWTDYYLDEWIITNCRVIDIDQQGFFKRNVSTLNIEKIQDITVDISGPIETLLGFGTLFVQSAGTRRSFCIFGISDPLAIRTVLLSLYRKRIAELGMTQESIRGDGT